MEGLRRSGENSSCSTDRTLPAVAETQKHRRLEISTKYLAFSTETNEASNWAWTNYRNDRSNGSGLAVRDRRCPAKAEIHLSDLSVW